MKKLHIIVAALAAFTVSAHAQTPTPQTFALAVAAKKALTNPSPAQVVAADQAILATPDITLTNKGNWTHVLAHDMIGNAAPTADVMAVMYQNAQFDPARFFVEYLENAIRFGDPYKSTALGQVAAFVSANSSDNGQMTLKVQATAAHATGQFDLAVTYWTALANTFRTYTPARGGSEPTRGEAILRVGENSRARGDSPKATNALVIPLLTAYNVHVADGNFQKAYAMVNRSVGANGSFAAVGDVAAFLNNVNSLVDTTAANKDFLSLVQSQLAAVTSNSN